MKNKLNVISWRNRPIITYLFLGIQTILFLAMELIFFRQGGSSNVYVLDAFGAMSVSQVAQGQWWRLIMPIFLHIGWMHFIINSLTLYFLGSQVEGIFGHTRFFLIYLLSGIMGNVFSFGLNSGNSISAGASTALFGLFSTYLVLTRIFKHNPYIKAMANSYASLLVINLVLNLFMSQVDIFGHLGGVIGGLLSAYCVSVPKASKLVNIHIRIISGMIYVFLIVVFILLGLKRFGYIVI